MKFVLGAYFGATYNELCRAIAVFLSFSYVGRLQQYIRAHDILVRDTAMVVAGSASVSQATTVSTSSFVRSSRCLEPTRVVLVGIKISHAMVMATKKVAVRPVAGASCRIRNGFVCGSSSSRFFASKSPFSFEALGMEKADDKPNIKSCTYFLVFWLLSYATSSGTTVASLKLRSDGTGVGIAV